MTKATKAVAPAVAEATPATTVVVKPNARAHLRALFSTVGATATKEQVYADYHNVTINTHLTDMKNPNYCGKAGVINIAKQPDGTYKRVA